MKFNFRQGIQHSPTTSNRPSFLVYNPGNDTITISVGTDLVRATAAYRETNYVIEERIDTSSAWGPFAWNLAWGTDPLVYHYYLYWDINLSSGIVTRGHTPWEPISAWAEPVAPRLSQHWFDRNTNVMKYWDNQHWRECIRVFAAEWDTGLVVITEYDFGSQVSITIESEDHSLWPNHGYILYGMDMKAVRYNDGTIVTTATHVETFHGSFSSPITLELANSTALAFEPIPQFYCVTNIGDDTIQLANDIDEDKRPIGIALTDTNPGEAVDVVIKGFIFNDQWNWDTVFGKDLYSGLTGELTQGLSGRTRVGTIIGPQTIIVDVDQITNDTNLHDASTITYKFSNPALDMGFPTVESALDYLLFSPLRFTSMTGGSLNEIGSTVTTVALTWAYNDVPTPTGPYPTVVSQSLTDYPGLLLADRAHTFTGLSITSNKTYTVTASDLRGPPISNSQTVAFSYKRYWGASALTSLTDSDIRGMSQEFASSEPKTVIYNCSGFKYPYYCYPAAWGNPVTVLVGGFFYSDYTVTTRAFTNASGHTASYNIIKFNGIQTASILNVVWN